MRIRSYIAVPLVILGVWLGAALVIKARSSTLDAQLAQMVPPEPARPAESPFSADHHEDMAWVVNRVLRRSKWSPEDEQKVLAMLQTPPDAPMPGPDDAEALGDFMETDILVSGLVDQYAAGVPRPKAVNDALLNLVIDMTAHRQPHVRMSGISHAARLGLIKAGGPLRDQVEHLARMDPDPEVRRRAQLKIGQVDGRPEDMRDCPTCPKGTP